MIFYEYFLSRLFFLLNLPQGDSCQRPGCPPSILIHLLGIFFFFKEILFFSIKCLPMNKTRSLVIVGVNTENLTSDSSKTSLAKIQGKESFFLERPYHISFFGSYNDNIIGTGKFISSATKDYQTTCAAEFYGRLYFFLELNELAVRHKISFFALKLNFGSDYASLLRAWSANPLLSSMSIELHDLVRELRLIFSCLNINIICTKIKAHQDDVKKTEELSILEKWI